MFAVRRAAPVICDTGFFTTSPEICSPKMSLRAYIGVTGAYIEGHRSFADAQDDKSGCVQDDKSGCVQETEGMKTETEAGESVSVSMSAYCDSNTGPSGPKPDALANCATPRIFTFSDTFQ